ncbi:MAG TPA: DUF5647 family protein, partial [Candidatus Methylomirabilis sp.]|nr:DUF5647 family protein [Candidatus Methylomirabilis sp.]
MTRAEKSLAERNLDLLFEFERYIQEHPAFAKRIPQDAIIALQVKGDTAFNRWSRRLAETQNRASRHPVVQITITRLGPV